ncbi:unnamed protein product, partial [Effrenium voratum]
VFLLEAGHLAGRHLVPAEPLLRLPKLRKRKHLKRFLVTQEEVLEGLDQVAADFPSAATWCQLLDSFKHPPLPYEVFEGKLDTLQERFLRLALREPCPSDATLVVVETGELLERLNFPAEELREAAAAGAQGAVQVLGGLRQLGQAMYGGSASLGRQEQLLMQALGARTEEPLPPKAEVPETSEDPQKPVDPAVARARAWLSSRGILDLATPPKTPTKTPTPATLAATPRSSAALRAPSSWTTPRRSRSLAAEVRHTEALHERLRARAAKEKLPMPCAEPVRRAQQRAKSIQQKLAEQERRRSCSCAAAAARSWQPRRPNSSGAGTRACGAGKAPEASGRRASPPAKSHRSLRRSRAHCLTRSEGPRP